MTLQEIAVPDSIKRCPHADGAEHLIDTVNESIETFMLSDQAVIENFVTCDFHLLDRSLTWIDQNHLVAGDRFCEWGAGFAVAAMLAALRGMHAVGIEIEPRLVQESTRVAEHLGSRARIFCGSFVPRNVDGLDEIATEVKNVDTEAGDVYQEIGLAVEDFDLFFAFPWPGEHSFFEHVFDHCAADGALLLTYRGREGMHLIRKMTGAEQFS